MSKIEAKIIADSLSPQGDRLTTFVVTFPRIILAEFNTHRMFSRNSASSRAIPFEKMVKAVQENPFIPIAWQKDHKGMQGNEYLTDIMDIQRAEYRWLLAKTNAVEEAKVLSEGVGVTKQLCNRLLEPFMWHTVIVTATEWENFFALRCPQYQIGNDSYFSNFRSKKDVLKTYMKGCKYESFTEVEWLSLNKGQAEIHMMALAEAMWDCYNESTPKELKAGEWHIPFGDNITMENLRTHKDEELMEFTDWYKVKIATARCARVSYTVVGEEGKEPNYENDIKLHDRLLASKHKSPMEHCARAMNNNEYDNMYQKTIPQKNHRNFFVEHIGGWCRNYRGFIQYRELID